MSLTLAALFLLSHDSVVLSTSNVLMTCTQSHIVLTIPPLFTLQPRAIPKDCHHRRNNTIFIEKAERKCMSPLQPLLIDVSPIGFSKSDLDDVIAISCSSHSKIVNDKVLPVWMDVQIFLNMNGSFGVELKESDVKIIDSKYAVPIQCQIIHGVGEMKIIPLTDESGCPLSSEVTPFTRRPSRHGVTYTARVNVSLLERLSIVRFQCSVVACGDQCLKNNVVCTEAANSFSSSLIVSTTINTTSLLKKSSEPVSENEITAFFTSPSSFQRQRLLIIINLLLVVITGVTWFLGLRALLLHRRLPTKMIVHRSHSSKTKRAPLRLHIVHPVDSFSSTPPFISGKMSAIKMKFNNLPSFGKRSGRELAKGLQINSPPSCTRTEHLSIHELHKTQAESLRNVLPLLMDSLLDPPQLSVTDLAQLEMMARLNEINLPFIKNVSTLSNHPSSEYANLSSVAVRVLPTSLLLVESGLKENRAPDIDYGYERASVIDLRGASPDSFAVSIDCYGEMKRDSIISTLVDDQCEFNTNIVDQSRMNTFSIRKKFSCTEVTYVNDVPVSLVCVNRSNALLFKTVVQTTS